MRRCLQLARNGMRNVAPNPMVGAVLVADGEIVGEGYHVKCGTAHAEVNAIASVRDPEVLKKSTLYVSLEPCSHYGKTPPCADLIIEKGIPRVVVGCLDPFVHVSGRGVRKLQEAGVDVKVGVCEAECLELNKHFITFHRKKRPYITLKWAQSFDGYIDALRNSAEEGAPVTFSTPETRMRVHRLRSEHQAIMVGTRTALLDNPTLTVRHWSGSSPLRITVDRKGILPPGLNLFDGSQPTRVYTETLQKTSYACNPNVTCVALRPDEDVLMQIMADLYQEGVQSLLVEGGSRLLESFFAKGLWDEAFIEQSPIELGGGVKAPVCPKEGFCIDTIKVLGRKILRMRALK